MERITYRKTLDVHKNGIQFLLQGFETADNLSRVIETSLMASGDAVDFPLERVVAMMYVTTPNATEPSINRCTIKDNKIVYDVLPIVEEGITTMQIKIIETSPEGATSVLASPKFAVEVTKSGVDDSGAEQTTTFTALEDAMAKAKTVYDERFLRMELTNDCIFKAYYADGTEYETDILKKLFHNGNVLLSESYAHGGTGVRTGEDTDNAKYYSNLAQSEALNAKNIMVNSEEILEEVKLHGVYTAFSVDFETGEVEYVSPSFKFNVNIETGELDAIGQSYSFNDEVFRVVENWLADHGVVLTDLQNISTKHSKEILELQETSQEHSDDIELLKERVTPIEKGGTEATNPADARENLGFGWISLGSTFISHEIPSNFNSDGNSVVTSEIPVDSELSRDYNYFRYVIKQGSSIYVKANTGSYGYEGRYEVGARLAIEGRNLLDATISHFVQNYKGEEDIEHNYTFEEDMPLNAAFVYTDECAVLSGSTLNVTRTSLPSAQLAIMFSRRFTQAGTTYYDAVSVGTAKMSLVIELQGRR